MCQSFAASRRHHAFARCLGRGGSEFNRASTFFRISHLSVARGRFWIARRCWAREGGDEYTLNDGATLLSNSVIAPGSERRSSSIASRARPAFVRAGFPSFTPGCFFEIVFPALFMDW